MNRKGYCLVFTETNSWCCFHYRQAVGYLGRGSPSIICNTEDILTYTVFFFLFLNLIFVTLLFMIRVLCKQCSNTTPCIIMPAFLILSKGLPCHFLVFFPQHYAASGPLLLTYYTSLYLMYVRDHSVFVIVILFWLTSLHKIISISIHMVINPRNLSFLTGKCYLCVCTCTYYIFFIKSSMLQHKLFLGFDNFEEFCNEHWSTTDLS